MGRLVNNRKTTPPSDDVHLERIVFNLAGRVRRAKLGGRDHIVVPAVMITEGVHEGSGGPGYYPEPVIRASDFQWNHQPIVVYHPENEDGSPKSARTEDVLNTRKIGLVLNTKTKDKKQKIEAWLDYKLTKKIEPRIIKAIENGEKVEVSTGIGVKQTKKKGKWGDEKYNWVAESITPDHLAVLPDQVGACSIKDGAGLLQLNRAKGMSEVARRVLLRSVRNAAKPFGAKFVRNEMSFSQQSCAVSDALAAAYGEKGKYWRGYVVDVFPDYVIFCDDYGGKCPYYQVSYSVSKAGVVTLVDDKTEVMRTTEYKAVKNAAEKVTTTNEESQMKPEFKKKYRLALITNGLSKKAVLALEDGDLRAAYKATKPKSPEPAPAAKEPAKVVNRKIVLNGKKITREDYLALLTPRERAVINNGIKTAQKQRAKNIETIKKNAACPFKDEFLNNEELCPDNLLEGMAMMLNASEGNDEGDDPILKADFTGANGVVGNKGGDEDLPPVFEQGIYNGLKKEKATA